MVDAGQNGVFNANKTVLLGDSWVMSNGSIAHSGHAGSCNKPYYFGFAMDKAQRTVRFPLFSSTTDDHLITKSAKSGLT